MPAHHTGADGSLHESARPPLVEPHERSALTRPDAHPRDADRYRICVGGHLDDRWSAWFDGLALARLRDGTTVIETRSIDQAALHGLLGRIRDAGLRLISVTGSDPDSD
jgi:hypothetical protein